MHPTSQIPARPFQRKANGTSHSDDAEWAGHQAGTPEYRRVLCALTCAGVATFAQLYAPQGVLPRISAAMQVSAAEAALLVSASTIGLLLSVLPWSWIADRIGRVRTMKVSLVTATLLGLAVTAWPTFQGLLVLRVLEGIALGGLPAVAIAYLHEEIHPSRVAVAAAVYISGTSVGGLLGRVVAAPIAEWIGWRLGILCVTLIAAFSTVLFLVATPVARGFKPSAQRPLAVLQAVIANLRRPAMLVLFLQGYQAEGGSGRS